MLQSFTEIYENWENLAKSGENGDNSLFPLTVTDCLVVSLISSRLCLYV